MDITWLIESGVYGAEIEPLLAEIHRQGMRGERIPHRLLMSGSPPIVNGRPLEDCACVIGYGTFPFVRQIQLHFRWNPGAWCNAEALDCETYGRHFEQYWLNAECAIVSSSEAVNDARRLFEHYSRNGQVFVRPASCQKTFVGTCTSLDDFAPTIGPARLDSAARVLIAPAQAIDAEWRLVICGNQVVAGCQYARASEKDVQPELPNDVRAFAEEVLADVPWRPDPIFMLDVCKTVGQLKIVELNAFSSSWLYACNMNAVVQAASEVAGAMERTNRA